MDSYCAIYFPQLMASRTLGEVDFIFKILKLKRRDTLLNLGCDQCRQAIELADREIYVTSLAFSKHLLRIVDKEIKKRKVDVKLINHDMRQMNFFDSIMSVFLPFGFFSHKENTHLLNSIFASFKPGGKFLLDVINAHDLSENTVKNCQKTINQE